MFIEEERGVGGEGCVCVCVWGGGGMKLTEFGRHIRKAELLAVVLA